MSAMSGILAMLNKSNQDPLDELNAESIDYGAMSAAQVDAVKQIASFNVQQLPGYIDVATNEATRFSDYMNPRMKADFVRALEGVDKNYIQDIIGTSLESLNATRSYAQEMSSGVLPKDIFNSTMMALGEAGQSNGNSFLTPLRLMNKVSERKAAGIQAYGQLSALSGDLLGKVKSLTPPIVDRPAMGANLLSMLGSTAMGSSTIAQQGIIQATQTNADLAWSSSLSKYNAALDQTQYANYISQMQKAERMQQIGTFAGLGVGSGLLALGKLALSDRRLKRNIVRIGTLGSGLPWYQFKYIWSDQIHEGVMSDEVRRVIPDAVGTIYGYDFVNYARL